MSAAHAIDRTFCERDVVEVARDLIGCSLIGRDGTRGIIVEAEAYHEREPACHGYDGRRTPRTEVLFGEPGMAYVYFTYGMHWCLNLVCEAEGTGTAALIRAVQPTQGLDGMRARRMARRKPGSAPVRDVDLCSGPAKLVQAFDVRGTDSGTPLTGTGAISIVRDPAAYVDVFGNNPVVAALPRVGISVARELPWRFALRDCRYVSAPRPVQ